MQKNQDIQKRHALCFIQNQVIKPGKGAGEHLAPEDADKFEELSKIKDWRKKLSNFWIEPFYMVNVGQV